MNSAKLLLALLVLGALVTLIIVLLKQEGGPPASSTIVNDSEWNKAGVYPQWDDTDAGGHLKRMMLSNSIFGEEVQWTTAHFAFLFYPNVKYTETIQIGFLTTVHGMGSTPADVSLPLMCIGEDTAKKGALDVFWRGAENIRILAPTTCPPNLKTCSKNSDDDGGGIQIKTAPPDTFACPEWGPISKPTWAASQASALRRVVADKLTLDYRPPAETTTAGTTPPQCPDAFASGGFAADSDISFDPSGFGGQQQYMLLGVNLRTPPPAPNVWNFVFAGCSSSQPSSLSSSTTATTTLLPEARCNSDDMPNLVAAPPNLPISRNKPMLAWSAAGGQDKYAYSVYFDQVAQTKAVGVRPVGQPHAFSIATNEVELRDQLLGKSPVIILGSPKDIDITSDLVVDADGTTILGVGMPVLLLKGGSKVNVRGLGCCLCGIIFDCRSKNNDYMLCWGEEKTTPTSSVSSSSIGLLADCCFRVGGGSVDPTTVSCSKAMCCVEKGTTLIIENAWMWRADHGSGKTGQYDPATKDYFNNSTTGLWVKEGATVYAYGLACEHSTGVNCQWDGDDGVLYFYQCELPYCVEEGWNNPGLKVTGKNFNGIGLGVYCYFADKTTYCNQQASSSYPMVDVGVVVQADSSVNGAMTVWLNGVEGQGGIKNVIKRGDMDASGGEVNGQAGKTTAVVCGCKA